MVTRVGDLVPHVGEVTTKQLLLMDDTTFALSRVPADRFRGAGWFNGVGIGKPDVLWPGVVGGAYKDSDMFRQTSADMLTTTLWYWDINTTDWLEFDQWRGATFHTAVSLGVTTFETSVDMGVTDPNFSVGDFYRNLSTSRLYGPYTVGGFNFHPVNGTYTYERGYRQFKNTTTQTTGTRGIPTWSPADIIDATDLMIMPVHGDVYKQDLVSAIHGGYTWYFDSLAYEANNGADHNADLVVGWGTKAYTREPRVFLYANSPTDADHLDYITGDYWRDSTNEVLWGPYDGTADVVTGDATAHRIAAWGTAPVSERHNNMYVIDTTTVPYIPTLDNVLYVNGDQLVVNNVHAGTNLPILYGPYTDNGDPWPEVGSMRATHEFVVTQVTGTAGVFGAIPDFATTTDAVYVSQGLPIKGDTVRVNYVFPTGHALGTSGELTTKSLTYTVDSIDYATLAITTTLNTKEVSAHVHVNSITGVLPPADFIYTEGDILIDSAFGVFGPYVEGQTVDTVAWPIRSAAPGTGELKISSDSSGVLYILKVDVNGLFYLEEA